MPTFNKTDYDNQHQHSHMMTGSLTIPSEDRRRSASPTPNIASALLEEGLLKTVDVPGYDIGEDYNTNETLTANLTHDNESNLPIVWQDDTLAVFHFSLYTLRPGNKNVANSPAAPILTETIDNTIEEEEENDTHNAVPNNVAINITENNGNGVYEEQALSEEEEEDHDEDEEDEEDDDDEVEEDQFPAYAMAALQRRMSAFSLEPPLTIAAQPDRSSFDAGSNNGNSNSDYESTEVTMRGSMDSGVSGVQVESEQEYETTSADASGAATLSERVVIRELVRDTRTTPHGRPFELRIGRGFTAAALEIAIKSMRVGEQSRFLLRRECTEGFAQLERALRLQDSHSSSRRGSLSGTLLQHATASSSTQGSPVLPSSTLNVGNGTSSCLHQLHQHHLRQRSIDPADAAIMHDLETLPLELHIHLLEKRAPTRTGEQWWRWSRGRRLQEALVLRQLGNRLYADGDWLGATARYEMCLTLLEPMPDDQHLSNDDLLESIAEDAEDVDEKELQHVCLLNLAACDLKLRRYAQCIKHCDMALAQRPGDAKAHYRRATARIALGEELPRAREDLEAARSLMISELRRRGRRMSGVPGLTPGFPSSATPSLPIPLLGASSDTNNGAISGSPINTAGLLGIPFGSTGRTDSGISCVGVPEFYTGDTDAANQVYDTDVIGDDDDDDNNNNNATTQLSHSSASPVAAVNILSSMRSSVGNTTVSAHPCQTFSAEPVSDNPDPHDSKSIELQQAFQQLRRAEQAEENRARLLFRPDSVA
ncbi:hypothetical protein BDF22DRAFT_746702 [Syncephalis plumigaleata]|nr:hypothetical protein BDF22DRAFT_746702 [Syncephalis plumigaleata]